MTLPIVNYSSSLLQMGDLLLFYGVDFHDFSVMEKEALINQLECYLKLGFIHKVVVDLKKVKIQLCGADEISYLYHYVTEDCDNDA